MTVHEPREIIPVHTPLGFGHAIFIEFGEHDTFWTVALSNQAIVAFPQSDIRISRSYTHGRGISIEGPRAILNRIPVMMAQAVEAEYQRLNFGHELP